MHLSGTQPAALDCAICGHSHLSDTSVPVISPNQGGGISLNSDFTPYQYFGFNSRAYFDGTIAGRLYIASNKIGGVIDVRMAVYLWRLLFSFEIRFPAIHLFKGSSNLQLGSVRKGMKHKHVSFSSKMTHTKDYSKT